MQNHLYERVSTGIDWFKYFIGEKLFELINHPSRLQTSFLGLFISAIVVNTSYGHLLFSDLVIARFTAFVMLVFVSLWLLFGSVWVNGHKAYDEMEDLYVQTEGERILIMSRDGLG